jgi:cyanophycin synthetase
MQLVEVRQLEGPNLFLLRPAIKLEFALEPGEDLFISGPAADLLFSEIPDSQLSRPIDDMGFLALLSEIVGKLHERVGIDLAESVALAMETPNHYVVAFAWERRQFAVTLARAAWAIAEGSLSDIDVAVAGLTEIAATAPTKPDIPEMLTDDERTVPIIAVTGTNGKTTTTRLIASCLMTIGRKVGWTSSAGVMIQHELVEPGDFTGPAGAMRVFEEPGIDVAVLETARGGILLRGVAYESNDVSVVTNVTGDHLGLHGVHTNEGLRDVKSVVAQVTSPSGYVVLNAEDPLSYSVKDRVRASVVLFAKTEAHEHVRAHRAEGGWVVVIREAAIFSIDSDGEHRVAGLAEVPMTFSGRAPHMVENALAGTAALLAAGLTIDEVRRGLAAFHNEASQNRGRLNVFSVKDGFVVLDFAHNPPGLELLLAFAGNLRKEGGRVITVAGTAGDRTDDALRRVGELAAQHADYTIFKDTVRYLRGREPGEILPLMHAGFEEGGGGAHEDAPSERDAALRALEMMRANDVVALMCIEDYDFLIDHLNEIGKPYSG